MAIAVCKFSENFRESMPSDPPRVVLALKLLQINSAGKNTLEKKTKIDAPSLKKFLNTLRSDMKHFQKAYLHLFPSLNVFAFS